MHLFLAGTSEISSLSGFSGFEVCDGLNVVLPAVSHKIFDLNFSIALCHDNHVCSKISHLHIYLGQGRPHDGLADHKDNLHTGRERNHDDGHRVIDGRPRCVCEGRVRAHVHLARAEDQPGHLQAESGHSSLPQVYRRTRHLRL